MEPWQVALGVITALIAIFGLSFTVFWNIIKGVEKTLNEKINDGKEKIESVETYVNGRIDRHSAERNEESKSFNKSITYLSSQNEQKPTYKCVEEKYTRKKEHDLEMRMLNDKLDNLLERIRNKKGDNG